MGGIPGVIGAGRLWEAREERAGQLLKRAEARRNKKHFTMLRQIFFNTKGIQRWREWELGVQGTGSENFKHLVIHVIIIISQRRPLKAPPAAIIPGKVGYLAGRELAIVIFH